MQLTCSLDVYTSRCDLHVIAPMWFKYFHSESFLIQFRIWNNSSSWFMCSISPIRITTSHRSICCNQYLLKSNNSNKCCVQQSSNIHIEPNLYKCCGCHGVMFSELSNPAGMPRFLVCTGLYSVQMCPEVNGNIFHDWRIITGGMNCVLHEPITGSVNFDVFI